MKRNIVASVMLLLLAGGLFTSCQEEWTTSNLELDGEAQIMSFSVNGVEGEINQEENFISVYLPKDTEVDALSPQVEIPAGATITPSSGETTDFSSSEQSPVVFRVENGNLFREYDVVVQAISAKINSFSVGERQGVINHEARTINLTVPFGTDLTDLQPEIEYTDGAVISPAANEALDFSSTVIYTLTFMEETFEYSVTVEEGEEVIPDLVIYNGEDVVPSWWTVGSAGDIASKLENPQVDGINATSYCASIWRNPQDDPWTGGGLGGLDIDPSKYVRFSLMVLKEVAGDVQMEIQGEGAGNQYLKVNYTAENVGKWQQLEFTLPEGHGLTKITTILVAPQIDDTKNDPDFFGHRMYWDQLIALPAGE